MASTDCHALVFQALAHFGNFTVPFGCQQTPLSHPITTGRALAPFLLPSAVPFLFLPPLPPPLYRFPLPLSLSSLRHAPIVATAWSLLWPAQLQPPSSTAAQVGKRAADIATDADSLPCPLVASPAVLDASVLSQHHWRGEQHALREREFFGSVVCHLRRRMTPRKTQPPATLGCRLPWSSRKSGARPSGVDGWRCGKPSTAPNSP